MMLNPANGAEIRRFAARVLRRNRVQATLTVLLITGIGLLLQACLTLIGVTGAPDEPPMVTLLSNVVTLLVSAPLQYGMYELFTCMVRGQRGSIRDIFLWFAEGGKLKTSLLGSLWFGLLAFVQLLIFLLPAGILCGLIFGAYASDGAIVLLFLVLLGAALLASAQILLYMPGSFMLAEEPARPVTQCFTAARQGMKPYKWKFFRFYLVYAVQLLAVLLPAFLLLSFLPLDAAQLYLLFSLLASLASLWIMPRMYIGSICYYRAVFALDAAEEDEPFAM